MLKHQPVFEGVAGARGRLRAIGKHHPVAVRASCQVDAEHVQIEIVRDRDAVARAQERRVGECQWRRQQAAAQEKLRTVQVEEHEVEQPCPLGEAALEPFPLLCGNDERHHVELPRSIDALRIAVDVVGDAVLADRAPRVVPPRRELVGADGFDAAYEALAVLAQRARPVEHLVERPGHWPIVPQQAPREHRTGRERGIAECAHRNPRTCRSVRLGAVGRRRSSVKGKSGFRSSAATCIRPGV